MRVARGREGMGFVIFSYFVSVDLVVWYMWTRTRTRATTLMKLSGWARLCEATWGRGIS